MCEWTSTQAGDTLAISAVVQEQNTPTHTDVPDSFCPLWLFLSEPLANRHACGQILPHKVGGLCSLHVACGESLKRNCQQGKSPILQPCPQRDRGNSRLHYLDFFPLWLWWQKKPATQGERDQANSGNVQNFAANWSRSTIIGPHLWKSLLLLTSQAPSKAISYSTFYTQFWQKFRLLTIDFTATILTLPPPPPALFPFQSPSIDTKLCSQQTGVFCVGGRRGGEVLTCGLNHFRPFKCLTSGFSWFYFSWFGSKQMSSIGCINHEVNYRRVLWRSPSNIFRIFKCKKGAFCLLQVRQHSQHALFRCFSKFWSFILRNCMFFTDFY